jgi:hypothetical protein
MRHANVKHKATWPLGVETVAKFLCGTKRGVVGFGVSVMDDHVEAHVATYRRPLQHLEITIGIAQCRNRAAAATTPAGA